MLNYLGQTVWDLYKSQGKKTKRYSLEDARAIGATLGINWEDSPFDVNQFLMGLHVELEHGTVDSDTNITGDDDLSTAKIALAHLREKSDYYTRLKEVEKALRIALDIEFDKHLRKSSNNLVKVTDEFLDRCQHLFGLSKAERGSARPGHRYIRREGSPGNYKYIYEVHDETIGSDEKRVPQRLRAKVVEYKNAKEAGDEGKMAELRSEIKTMSNQMKVEASVDAGGQRKKALWEMTKDEFIAYTMNIIDGPDEEKINVHREIVRDAVEFEGVEVPEKVADEYPDLKGAVAVRDRKKKEESERAGE